MKVYNANPRIELMTVSSKLRGSRLITKTDADLHWLPAAEGSHTMSLAFGDEVSDEGQMTLIELIKLTADIANGDELIVEVTHGGAFPGSRVSRLMQPRIIELLTRSVRGSLGSVSRADLVVELEYSHMELYDLIEA